MRRLLTVSNLITTAIIATVVAMVAYANWRDAKRVRIDTSARPAAKPR